MNTACIPMKWPGGPLEIARRARAQTLTGEIKDLLLAWHDPKSLEVLKGSPVDCLIVNWAGGAPEDQEQQRTLAPLIAAGRAMGISFVGAVSGRGGHSVALAAGAQAGLAAALVQETPAEPPPLPVILACPRSKIPRDSAFPLLSVSDNRWPGVELKTMQGDEAIAGPTGVPWVDSNGWFSLLAHQRGEGKQIWLNMDPPDTRSRHAANYSLAVADCEAYGSRWLISLDDRQRLGLLRNDPRSADLWDGINTALAFFKEHRAWRRFQPQGVLGVISDFRGQNEFLAEEVLNLLSRGGVQWRVIDRFRSLPARLDHLKFIVWPDEDAPDAEWRCKLLAFADQGGVLIVPPSWKISEGQRIEGPLSEHYELRKLGKGRIARSREAFQDPYQTAVDIHLLVSRRNDLVRLFNADAANCFCSAPSRGKGGLVHVLNYASSGPADFVSVWVKGASRRARLWNFKAKQPADLRGQPVNGGVEFDLPSFSTYTALEFDAWG